jgi:hypothetical protein
MFLNRSLLSFMDVINMRTQNIYIYIYIYIYILVDFILFFYLILLDISSFFI